MDVSRRGFLSLLGAGAAAASLPGCICVPPRRRAVRLAAQLRSVCEHIGGKKDRSGDIVVPGVGLDKTFRALSAIGYEGVEFDGYYLNDAKTLKSMLDAHGLVACGSHVGWAELCPEMIAKTCDFSLGYGNNLLVCSGGNLPGDGENLDDFLKKLVDCYNAAAANAAQCGCRIGLCNNTWEFKLKMADGTSYWDYFFKNADPAVRMEINVGAAVGAGADPCEEMEKYPHRSPTLCATECGVGGEPGAVLGRPGARGVDWDDLVSASERNGVEWYAVECDCHYDGFSALLPSYEFLKRKVLG